MQIKCAQHKDKMKTLYLTVNKQCDLTLRQNMVNSKRLWLCWHELFHDCTIELKLFGSHLYVCVMERAKRLRVFSNDPSVE